MMLEHIDEYVRRQRIKAWIYVGVETELELAGLQAENNHLRENDPDHSDIHYNKKLMIILQRKLELANTKVERFSSYD